MAAPALLAVLASLFDKVIPDPQAAAEAKLRAMELAQRGDLAELDADVKLALGQIEINKIEAQSPSMFNGGWRPAIGWTCVMALWMIYVPRALVMCIAWGYQVWIMLVSWGGVGQMPSLPLYPELGLMDLLGLVSTLLGTGAMRSLDKMRGVDTKMVKS